MTTSGVVCCRVRLTVLIMSTEVPSLGNRLRKDAGELARLAWPVILSRSGVMMMALVDTIMVGQYASQELAYLSMGLAPFGPMLVAGVGICMGTQVIAAMTFGEGRLHDVGAVWRRGAPFAFAVGLIGTLICLFGEAGLFATGQSADLAAGGGEILMILGLGLPFVLFFIASSFFLEGINRPMPGLYFMVFANVVNLFLNWALIYGNAGFPELGAAGSAWATTILRITLALGIAVYIWNLRDHAALGIRRRAEGTWASWSRQRRIGYASSWSIGGESLGFGITGIMIGTLGPLALGAHAILFNLIVFTAMIAIGVSTATSVRVGQARGAKAYSAGRLATITGLVFATLAIGVIAASFIVFNDIYAAMYTADDQLARFVAPLIAFLAAIVVIDANRVVMNSSLRGRGETWVPAVLNTTAFLVIMMPMVWLLGLHLGHGLDGVYSAVLIAGLASFILLGLRFIWLARRDPTDGAASDG